MFRFLICTRIWTDFLRRDEGYNVERRKRELYIVLKCNFFGRVMKMNVEDEFIVTSPTRNTVSIILIILKMLSLACFIFKSKCELSLLAR